MRVLVVLGLAACASSGVVYQPEGPNRFRVPGGEVRISQSRATSGELELRLWVVNHTDETWGVDAHQQLITLRDGEHLAPYVVEPGYYTVPPHSTGSLRLRYAQPPGADFRLAWQIETPEGPLGQATWFARANPNRTPNGQPERVPGSQTVVTPQIPGTAPSPIPPAPSPPGVPTEP